MKQGEIWLIDLDPAKGSEMQKKRSAIIINDDSLGILPLKIIVPVTDWKDRYQIAIWMIKIEQSPVNGLTKLSAIDCFQVRSLSQERFIKKLGSVDDHILDAIKDAFKKIFSQS